MVMKNKIALQCAALVYPVVVSLLFGRTPPWCNLPGTAVCFLLFVALAPGCRCRANLWMFVLVSFGSIRGNVEILQWLFCARSGTPQTLVHQIIQGSLPYCFLFSVEQLLMGAIATCIWPHQDALPEVEG